MAKISPVGSNMTVLHGKKYDVLFSYETPVAAKDVKTGEVFKTSKKWSATTSKHISKWLAGEKASEKPQEFFDDLDESKKDPAKQIAEALNIMLKGKSLNESNEEESEDGIWWSSSSAGIEIQLTKDQAESASVGGVDNESAIDDLLTNPEISSQFDDISDDALKSELEEYGAWDDEELSDREMNIKRVLWLAAGDISNGLVEGDMNESRFTQTDFGTVEYMGKIYTLKNQADFTNRLLPGNFVNYHDAEEGEEFDFEMAADATSESGEDCTVYWIFSHTKGESDSDWDSFDYTDVDRVVCGPLEDEDDLDEEYEDLDESNLNESTSDWSNKQVIDSRDIIKRLQELEDDIENLDESDKEELELLRAVNEDWQH